MAKPCRSLLLIAAMLALASAFFVPVAPQALLAQVERENGPSGLPLPRFVSLKSDRVNVRGGPGWDHEIAWVFLRIGLPVEIIAEYGNWRQIRDSEGAVGWVYRTLLSGRRTALVAPWIKGDESQTFPLYTSASEFSRLVARLGPSVLLDVSSCDGQWCRVATASHRGWITQERLWGIYPNETVN